MKTTSIVTLMIDVNDKMIVAATEGNFPLFEIGHALLYNFAFINSLLKAIQNSPRQSFNGSNGVVKALGTKRSTTYKRIHDLGLTPDDFRYHCATATTIMEKSPVVQDLLRNWHLATRE